MTKLKIRKSPESNDNHVSDPFLCDFFFGGGSAGEKAEMKIKENSCSLQLLTNEDHRLHSILAIRQNY